MAAGNDMAVLGMAEAGNIPIAVSGPEVLADTMKRNEDVLMPSWDRSTRPLRNFPSSHPQTKTHNREMVMNIDRRTVLGLSGYALAASLLPVKFALAATELKALRLVERAGETLWVSGRRFEILQPALQQRLKIDVAEQTIAGNDGFAAIQAVMETADRRDAALRLFLMGMQSRGEPSLKTDIRFDDMLPIAKLTKSISVALIAKQGSPLMTWADLAAAKTLQDQHRAARDGNLCRRPDDGAQGRPSPPSPSMRVTLGEVIDDVTAGRQRSRHRRAPRRWPSISINSSRSSPSAPQRNIDAERRRRPSPRSPAIPSLPSPRASASSPRRSWTRRSPLASRKAFMAAGNDMDVQGMAEAQNIPLAVSGPEILTETMKRNEEVLARVLG